MQILSKSEFQQLGESASQFSVSIYLPTHVAGPDIRQDSIRLKNLARKAVDKLTHAGMETDAAEAMLSDAFALLDDQEFWRYQSQGLALFLTPETTKVYRLPLNFESLTVVSDRFHLKPLLPLFFDDQYFYLLALSQNQVRFFQATRYQISEIPLENIPASLDEALKYDDPEKQLQYHSGSNSGQQPVYHGQGAGQTDDKTDIRRFLIKVNNGLQTFLNAEKAPLVIASVDYLQSIYQEINTYSNLLTEGVSGNPDTAQPIDLQIAAWEKVAALLKTSHQDAFARYQTLKETDESSSQLEEVVLAAARGQVDTLFVAVNAHQWGILDAQANQVKIHDSAQVDSDDLLDIAAVQTFLQGGTVYTLDAEKMPNQASVAAIYRYPVFASA